MAIMVSIVVLHNNAGKYGNNQIHFLLLNGDSEVFSDLVGISISPTLAQVIYGKI